MSKEFKSIKKGLEEAIEYKADNLQISSDQANELYHIVLSCLKDGRDGLTIWGENPKIDPVFYEWWKHEIRLVEEISGKKIDDILRES